jgi:ABC-type multidrug transport system fused ATPase/permease subunit
VFQENKPRAEVLLVVLEELAVLAELVIHIIGGHGTSTAMIACWAYVAALTSFRLLFSAWNRPTFSKLWYHTAFLYGWLWLFNVLVFRSAIIHPRSKFVQALSIADFALVTLLAIIALTSRKGNKPVELEYEGDLEPSGEQTASVLSLATFSWLDKLIVRGYRKTTEMEDVWNLPPKDKAATVVSDYRQLKKTQILAWHLLRYFRTELLIQASWAGFSGLLTFAPTLLLKAILEYMENPSSKPANAAWFFVILLFISGCAAALADGQTLWIGRKICIRLRAIIIGELYDKALKRRVSTGTDKILGQEKKEAQAKQKLLERVVSFVRKKKAQNPQNVPTIKAGQDESQVSSGAIINLMAVDSFKVAEICAYLHFLWAISPVQCVVALVLLYRILGYSSIAGIGMMAALLPVNLVISKQFAKKQKQILAATDGRINTTNEVLSNIRIIKFFAWEQRFMDQVNEKRVVEIQHLRGRYILWATAATVWAGAPILITFLSFLVYTVVEKKDLVPSVAFTALSLFQILRIPLDQLADMVAHVQESKVSVDRIEEYLNEPETDKYELLKNEQYDEFNDPVIGFDDATFSWGGKDQDLESADSPFRMIDLNVRFKVGQLNVVAGSTGCGKTSLLMALLGEMTRVRGEVFLPGSRSREDLAPDPKTGLTNSVAYCAQQAWLVNDTIKENIVFASPWDPIRYKRVIEACSLQRDLEILDAGDETLVGEKGVTLSGGQKQRISLARALYSKARHLLLDDILSAVDSHTSKWIFDRALLGPLMQNRTCILVTHNVALCMPYADFAVVIDNGRITAQGTASEVIESGKLTEDLTKSLPASRAPSRIPSRAPSEETDGDGLGMEHTDVNGNANGHQSKDDDDSKKKQQTGHHETKAEGRVKLNIIVLYLKSMGPWYFWIFAAATFALQQISSVATNVWIREWASAYTRRDVANMAESRQSPITHSGTISGLGSCLRSGSCVWPMPTSTESAYNVLSNYDVDVSYYLGVYAVLGIVYMIISFLREVVLFGGSLAASRKIHLTLMERVMRAKFRFFDSTPLGQLMNRFSKDIEAVDQEVAPVAVGVIHCLASIITIVILISVITPGFLIAGVFISILYFLIGKLYINSSRDLKRLESVQRSPLYQQFGETLSGMTTIRAYGDERRFIRENLKRVNTHNRPFIFLWAANRWLALRVDVVGALVSFFSGVFVVLSVGRIDAGAAGLAMTYAVTFTENVLWFVRLYASNEQNMNSVERVKEYLDVEQEAAPIVPENRPPANWPSRGEVEFIGYSTRYRKDFDFVLKGITFKIQPGEKVGVVGRTGAGKSSLALALFRALEAEQGKILVDDVDIGLIGLSDLRENIVMVPQGKPTCDPKISRTSWLTRPDPTLFTGTIRSNLDPFNLFTDEQIFDALRRVHLISAVPGASPTDQGANGKHVALPSDELAAAMGEGSPQSATNEGSTRSNTPSTSRPATANKNLFESLSSPVTESGNNLSQGQRQLLCLARALLKDPTILLMDEATASVDYATDARIQDTIREVKKSVITIAHRLRTIIDYDKVLVLDRGEVIEYGAPWDLLGLTSDSAASASGASASTSSDTAVETKGVFRGMCEMSGDMEDLEKEARKAMQARQLVNVDEGAK